MIRRRARTRLDGAVDDNHADAMLICRWGEEPPLTDNLPPLDKKDRLTTQTKSGRTLSMLGKQEAPELSDWARITRETCSGCSTITYIGPIRGRGKPPEQPHSPRSDVLSTNILFLFQALKKAAYVNL